MSSPRSALSRPPLPHAVAVSAPARFATVDKRFDELNKRVDDLERRADFERREDKTFNITIPVELLLFIIIVIVIIKN